MSTPRPARPSTPRVHSGHWTRYAVMWLALAWLLASFVVMVIEGARVGALVLAAELIVLGCIRAIAPSPGPYGITSRSRGFDVALLIVGGLGIGTLSLIAGGLDP